MVKPREKRVPIMMSEEEMAAIDDWRFANRVATRSDAIRRLCQIGLRTNRHFAALSSKVYEASDECQKIDDDWAEAIDQYEGAQTLEEYAKEVAVMFSEAFPRLHQTVIDAHNLTSDFGNELLPFLGDLPVEDAINMADQEISEAAERWRQWALEDLEKSIKK